MTAEFVIVLPAVLVVLVLAIGGIMLATQRVVLTSAAAEISRFEARGDDGEAAARLRALPPGVQVTRSKRAGLQCVSLSLHPIGGLLGSVGVTARGCAALIAQSAFATGQGPATARGQPTLVAISVSLPRLTATPDQALAKVPT